MTVSAGSSTDTKLKLQRKGLPRLGDGRGDLLLRLKIVIPRGMTEEHLDWLRRIQDNAPPRVVGGARLQETAP